MHLSVPNLFTGSWLPLKSGAAASTGRVRLQTLVLIRWIAVTGQALALLLVHYGLQFPLPLGPTLAVVGASVLFNLVLFLWFPSSTRLSDRDAALCLGFDLAQLTALLYLTGGLGNPFALLVLVPVTISASILSLRSTVSLNIVAIAGVTLLAWHHMPLPWSEPRLELPTLYQTGVWVALVLGILFVSIYAWQVAAEARRMSDALAATQAALAREQHLSALGGLAAAAAHELGTPLGTIAVVAKELSREIPPDSPLSEDVALLASQAQRCREILARLSRRPEQPEGGGMYDFLPIVGLIEAAAAPHQDRKPIRIDLQRDGQQPTVPRSAEILHGLGNLVENAADFARSLVTIRVGWTASEVKVEVLDDGPGINVDVLSALGEPYTTTRPEGGMGLGIFIAKTLLAHSGAQVDFFNRTGGGAGVVIAWPRALLEPEPGPTPAMTA